ncbi:RagB/SusD family nutrient uptake outer membrane protein [Ulvibacter litoralis]|uniref:SusD family protein n=1 Tax=Ulvibacter litoralis TaxID=227084 RepID=A0A1G7DQD1_9FLAO|nr:RagB/SusD family nutrient uptake outer membrane protein [Ulvibacter litoralis]GHC42820.1 hypothetical protein GCM10008083_01280 [Ulvibacter litoralis]SDE53045.1 SusD family protein [Ulvibacter litoralis]
MKNIKIYLVAVLIGLVTVSCEVEDGQNLNGPTTDSVSSDLSRGELDVAMAGALSDMRVFLGTQVDAQAVAGREYWRFQSSDPRWTGDLLTGILDNNTFYTTNPYASRYATIKDINLLLEGLENTTADFSAEEIAASKGFANTLKAHELLMVLNQQYQNGIRIDVSDPDNLGEFVDYNTALTEVFNLLSSAASDLSNGGGSFPFMVPSGFASVATPSSFLTFNRALAARVEVYRGNYASANSLLQNSFMDLAGDLYNGVYYSFSLTGADLPNPLFFSLNASGANARIVHPSFIEDAEANDARLSKAVERMIDDGNGNMVPNPLTQSNLTGFYDVFIYESNIDPVAIIRNEELILLYAEANHISSPSTAVSAINVIRNAAGIGPYTGGTSPAELVNEILTQRRYSLFAEGGHRWIDLRRFNRLNELPLDRSGDGTFEQFPTPLTENQ